VERDLKLDQVNYSKCFVEVPFFCWNSLLVKMSNHSQFLMQNPLYLNPDF